MSAETIRIEKVRLAELKKLLPDVVLVGNVNHNVNHNANHNANQKNKKKNKQRAAVVSKPRSKA